MSQSEQLERLARRINWLDRWRRPISVLFATIVAPLIVWWVTGWTLWHWVGAYALAAVCMFGAVIWYAVETAFGFWIALWETNYSQLTRPPGLPRARLLRRRK